ncbi:MAG: retropepsin-like aspartic protease [Bacteroidota bacterium]
MINTFGFQDRAEIEKDGKKILVPVPANIVLSRKGAVVPVIITHPKSVIDQLTKEGKTVPQVEVNALIDTGASSCVISPKIAEQLQLVQTGFRNITSVQDEQSRPVYYCWFMFPWGRGKQVSVASCPLKGIDCLIGRDIMQHWHFTYNGKDGFITICD